MALIVGLLAASTQGAGRWAVPVGWDAITHGLETWPQQRLGIRAMVRSTFDRAGGNEAADSSHYLYFNDSRAVAMSLKGTRGCLYFCRFNHWHGSPWNFAVDGAIHAVEETNTAAPARANLSVTSEFLPAAAFPPTVAPTYTATKGADLTWVPMLFADSLELSYSRTDYGTGYYIYHQFQPDLPTSRPVIGWTPSTPVEVKALETIGQAGSDLVTPNSCSSITNGSTPLTSGEHELVSLTTSAPASIRFIKLTAPATAAVTLGQARLKIHFDGRSDASVDAPIAMLHGAGILQESNKPSEYLGKTACNP